MSYVEPWMRGTLTELDPVFAALLHSLEHVREDVRKWTESLTQEQLWRQEGDLAPVGFHVRHIGGSTNRLITYAKGQQISPEQLDELQREKDPGTATTAELLAWFDERLKAAEVEVRALDPAQLHDTRYLGRKRLPVTMAALLIHTAEHAQRHVGEVVVTAKVVQGKQR